MPEFEENNSQPDPAYSYTPSTSTPKKTGGRRRSGGFKSEITTSDSKIGEVDPAEALKVEKARENNLQSSEAVEKPKASSAKNAKASSTECATDKKPRANDSKPQPSKATLDSIRSVEEKITLRRAENEKNSPPRSRSAPRKNNTHTRKENKPSNEGGLLAAVGRFFGKLLGNSPKGQTIEKQEKGRRSKNQYPNSQRGPRRDNSGTRRKNSRGGTRSHRNNSSKHT